MTILGRLHLLVVVLLVTLLVVLPPSQLQDILRAARDGDAPINWWFAFAGAGAYAVLSVSVLSGRVRPMVFVDSLLASYPALVLILLVAQAAPSSLPWSIPIVLVIWGTSEYLARHLDRAPGWLGSASALAGLALMMVFAIRLSRDPIGLPLSLGPVPLLLLGLITLGMVLGILVRHPWLGGAYLAVCIGAAFFVPPSGVPLLKAENLERSLDQGFIAWLDARADAADYEAENRPYPVIVASAEGGGIYAAAHAYNVLNALDKQCPNFAQHLFMTVGVSGGAMGQALFAAGKEGTVQPADLSPCNGAFPAEPPAVLERDYMSPLIANLLIVQVAEFLIPGPTFAPDGLAVLGRTFSEASGLVLEKPLREGWDPAGNIPATAFVATDIHAGRRFVMAPFTATSAGTAVYFPDYASGDIQMSAAAALSAAFPYVTGTGLLDVGPGARRILGDGGYVDNTGAQTVEEMVGNIRLLATQSQQCRANDLAYRASLEREGRLEEYSPSSWDVGEGDDLCQCPLIVHDSFNDDIERQPCERHVFLAYLTISGQEVLPLGAAELPPAASDPQPSYFWDPIDAAFAARSRASSLALETVRLVWTDYDPSRVQGETADIGLFDHILPVGEMALPLGWKLSHASASAIHRLSANLSLCPMATIWAEGDDGEPRIDVETVGEWTGGYDQINGCSTKMLAWLFNPAKEVEPFSLYGMPP